MGGAGPLGPWRRDLKTSPLFGPAVLSVSARPSEEEETSELHLIVCNAFICGDFFLRKIKMTFERRQHRWLQNPEPSI